MNERDVLGPGWKVHVGKEQEDEAKHASKALRITGFGLGGNVLGSCDSQSYQVQCPFL